MAGLQPQHRLNQELDRLAATCLLKV
nr:hypothetical protein LRH_04003 [Lacticaseibacillus rhamnosus HN001]